MISETSTSTRSNGSSKKKEEKTVCGLAFLAKSGWEPLIASKSSTCKKSPFEEISPCSDFRMGWGSGGGRHVGDPSDCSLCSFPLFRLVDGASWNRKLSSTPAGWCLNLWVLIEVGCVASPCSNPPPHHRPQFDNSHFNCVSGADREQIGHLLIFAPSYTIQCAPGHS